MNKVMPKVYLHNIIPETIQVQGQEYQVQDLIQQARLGSLKKTSYNVRSGRSLAKTANHYTNDERRFMARASDSEIALRYEVTEVQAQRLRRVSQQLLEQYGHADLVPAQEQDD